MTRKTPPDAAEDFTYGYDLTGLPTVANNPDATLSWSYDTAGRMVQETRGLLSVQYQYDAAGNRTRITWPDGYFVDYDYDELDRLIVANENGTTPLATYGYDDLSRRKSKLFHNNRETTYGYAANDNLQSLGHGPQGGSQNVAFHLRHQRGQRAQLARRQQCRHLLPAAAGRHRPLHPQRPEPVLSTPTEGVLISPN